MTEKVLKLQNTKSGSCLSFATVYLENERVGAQHPKSVLFTNGVTYANERRQKWGRSTPNATALVGGNVLVLYFKTHAILC